MTHPSEFPGLLASESAWLHRLARGLLSDDAAAADLAQDTLALALTKRPDLGGNPRRMRGWLRAAAHRLARAAWREKSSRTAHEVAAMANEAQRTRSEVSVERLETHRLLIAAVESLHEPYRSAVVMRYLEDRSPREIAQHLGLPTATVRQQLRRAFELLRARLQVRMAEQDREWRGALALFVTPGRSGKTLLLGGITMKAKYMVAAGVLFASFCGGILWSTTGLRESIGNEHTPEAAPMAAAVDTAGPEVERLPVDEAPPPPVKQAAVHAGTVFRVLDDLGEPIADALILAWANPAPGRKRARRHVESQTNTAGVARLEGLYGTGRAIVLPPGMPPALHSGLRFPGTHVIEMDRGRELIGRVRVNRSVPVELVTVRLEVHQLDRTSVPRSALDSVLRRGGLSSVVTRTRPDGTFRFHGLAANFEGRLACEERFILDPRGPLREDSFLPGTVHVTAAMRVAELDLLELPNRPCRLVYADNNAPVVGAWVLSGVRMVGESPTAPKSLASTDDEGRFFLVALTSEDESLARFCDPKRRPEFSSANLEIEYSDTRVDRAIETKKFRNAAEIVIRVPRIKKFRKRFRVVDSTGEPIRGAILRAQTLSEPTDADGYGECSHVASLPKMVTVAAEGFAFQKVATPAEGKHWHFVLQPGNRLRIITRVPDGDRREQFRLVVAYKTNPFVLSDDGPTEMHYALTPNESRRRVGDVATRDGRNLRYFDLDTNGNCELFGLRAHVPFEIRLTDCMGTLLGSRDFPTGLRHDETRTVTFKVTRSPIEIECTMSDPAGKPIRFASLDIIFPPDHNGNVGAAGASTDAQGVARLAPIYRSPKGLRAEIWRRGFVSQNITSLPSLRFAVTLQPAIDVVIRFSDEHGAPVIVRDVRNRDGNADRQAPGRYRIENVPRSVIEFRYFVGGAEQVARRDASTGTIGIQVPRVGSVLVSIGNPVDAGDRVVIENANGNEEPWTLHLRRPKLSQSRQGVTSLFPGTYRLRRPGETKPLTVFEVRAGQTTRVEL